MTNNLSKSMSAQPTILLFSPGPVDGYPPVQYQAKLLSKAGFRVFLVTTPLAGRKSSSFSFHGCSIRTVRLSFRSRARRLAAKVAFVAAIAIARWQAGTSLIAEISYDPEGVWFARYAPFRKKKALRIAHLHETLIDPENRYIERTMWKLLPKCDRIVVADRNRADLLQTQLQLKQTPLTIPNYPLLEDGACLPEKIVSEQFRVAYAGSIGFDQGFNAIIRSIPKWHSSVTLYVAGNSSGSEALKIASLAKELNVGHRVVFKGLIPLADVVPFLAASDLGLTLLCPVHDQWRFSAGASNKRYQCMQAGIAQISDINPDVPQIVHEQGIGRCVDPNDSDAIAQAINYYVANRDVCADAGRRAFELYRSRYHYELPFQTLINWVQSKK